MVAKMLPMAVRVARIASSRKARAGTPATTTTCVPLLSPHHRFLPHCRHLLDPLRHRNLHPLPQPTTTRLPKVGSAFMSTSSNRTPSSHTANGRDSITALLTGNLTPHPQLLLLRLRMSLHHHRARVRRRVGIVTTEATAAATTAIAAHPKLRRLHLRPHHLRGQRLRPLPSTTAANFTSTTNSIPSSNSCLREEVIKNPETPTI